MLPLVNSLYDYTEFGLGCAAGCIYSNKKRNVYSLIDEQGNANAIL